MKKIFLFLAFISTISAQEGAEMDRRSSERYLEFMKQCEIFDNGSDQAKMAICENILSSNEELLKTNPLVTFRAGSYLVTKEREKEGIDLLAVGFVLVSFDTMLAMEIDTNYGLTILGTFGYLYSDVIEAKSKEFFASVYKKIKAVSQENIDWILDAKFSYDQRWLLDADEDMDDKWPTEARIQEIRNEVKQQFKLINKYHGLNSV